MEKRAAEGDGVRGDEVISFTSHARQARDVYFRRITFWDAGNEREAIFLTNHLNLPAAIVAEIYRQRWQIEQFFRLLKQNLRVKTFVGTSANALKIQIWTALIALLLVKFLQLRSKFPSHLSRLMALLRQQIFVYRCLWRFLDHPLEPPPARLVPLPLFDNLPGESGQQAVTAVPQPPHAPSVLAAFIPNTAPGPYWLFWTALIRHGDSGARRTSLPRSTFTAAGWISCPRPTNSPSAPKVCGGHPHGK